MCIIDYIDKHEGFFMVLVTIVYVGTTIGILFANKKSANAAEEQLKEAKKQLKESQEQFEESSRLSCLPFLQIENPYTNPENPQMLIELPLHTGTSNDCSMVMLLIKNVGYGSATNIRYTWDYSGCTDIISEILPINAIMQGDSYYVQMNFVYNNECPIDKAALEWEYEDLLGNTYTQKVLFYFIDGDLEYCENDTPHN